MARPPISNIKLSDTLTLSECYPTNEHKGQYWLYDKVVGMNLAMGANTPQDAYVEALTYYQKRLTNIEKSYYDLKNRVNSFISQIIEDNEDC